VVRRTPHGPTTVARTNRLPTRGAPFAARLIEVAGEAPPPMGLRSPRHIGEAHTRCPAPISPGEEVIRWPMACAAAITSTCPSEAWTRSRRCAGVDMRHLPAEVLQCQRLRRRMRGIFMLRMRSARADPPAPSSAPPRQPHQPESVPIIPGERGVAAHTMVDVSD
jgi:hypothetical protein